VRRWLFGVRRVECPEVLDLRYYILAEEVTCAGDVLCESYGVEVVAQAGREVSRRRVRHLTFDGDCARAFVSALCLHAVTPETLLDVVEDLLAAGL